MAQQKRADTNYRLFGGINEKTSKYTLTDAQSTDIRNMDFNTPNALSKRPGYTQIVTGGLTGPVTGLYEFEKLNGASYIVASNATALFYYNLGTFDSLRSGFSSGQPFDFATFTNRLFLANGEFAGGWDGQTLLPLSVPCPPRLSTFSGVISYSPSAVAFGITGTPFQVYVSYNYLRVDGYQGPLSPPSPQTPGDTFLNLTQFRVSGFSVPSGYGITAIGIYLTARGPSFDPFDLGPANPNFFPTFSGQIVHEAFRFVTFVPTSTATLTITEFDFPELFTDLSKGFSGQLFCFIASYTPKYIEIGNDRLWFSGFSSAPSGTFYSEVGEPEYILPESIFETRTNDGDRNTGLWFFQDEMHIFKRKSFHKIVGDSPDNFIQVEISTEYGCLSNKAIAEYDNMLLFLDEKGVVEYNGSSWRIISQVVEPTMRRMNVTAALEKAVAVHYATRNQIWFGIPVDGSTVNNLTVVYDYLLKAWTFFDGFRPTAIAPIKGPLSQKEMWFGDASGIVHYFSPSFYADNGVGMSLKVKTKFDAPRGENVENAFRRLFLDVNQSSGVTGTVNVNVVRNYDFSTVQATFAIYQNAYQTRRDFGVNGRSIAFEFNHNSASLPLTMYGFTVQHRFIRNV